MPDYGAAPALWYLDSNDLDGGDRGLASDLDHLIEPQLYADIESWIAAWTEWHDCDEELAPPKEWVEEGQRLSARLRQRLEPLGYRIQDRLR